MSKSSRKERRQSLAARRADPVNPAQSMPIPVPVPPTASVSMSASALPENSESAYSSAALEALLDQLSAAGGGDTPDSPEFTEFLNSLRPPKSAPVTPVTSTPVETNKPIPEIDLPRAGGPTTEAGKRRSSQNSFKHGLAAGFSHFKLLSSETPPNTPNSSPRSVPSSFREPPASATKSTTWRKLGGCSAAPATCKPAPWNRPTTKPSRSTCATKQLSAAPIKWLIKTLRSCKSTASRLRHHPKQHHSVAPAHSKVRLRAQHRPRSKTNSNPRHSNP